MRPPRPGARSGPNPTGPVERVLDPAADIPCRTDPERWFSEQTAEIESAKALCRTCPIRVQCLADAIDRVEPWGVWGGEWIEHGVVVPKKRQRGRPRKVDTLRH